jgi:hypothetical protein
MHGADYNRLILTEGGTLQLALLPVFERDLPPATTARPALWQEGHTSQ